MTTRQKSFAGWLEKWVAVRAKTLTAQLANFIHQQKNNRQDILIYKARFNKMEELVGRNRDQGYLNRTQDQMNYNASNLITLEKQIVEEKKKLTKSRREFKTKFNPIELYSKIRRHKKVTDIRVEGNDLLITTKKILNKKEDFGRFRIRVGVNLADFFATNITYKYEYAGHQVEHPHIRGSICLGGYRDPLYAYDKQGDLYFVIDTLIHFLELADGKRDAYVARAEWLAYRIKV